MQVIFKRAVTVESVTFAAGQTVDASNVPAAYLPGLLKAGHCEVAVELRPTIKAVPILIEAGPAKLNEVDDAD
jgi:hypothetical protein